MKSFDYFEPHSLEEAVGLQQQGQGRGCWLAGGTDLLVQMKEHVRQPELVINLKKIRGLDDFHFDPVTGLRLGALVTAREVETSPLAHQHYAGLARACTDFASIQVRNRATIVGNVCRASPSADTLPPLLADDASLCIHGPRGTRIVPLEGFCTAPGRTILVPDEIVTHVLVPAPAPGTAKVYLKHGRREQMELATVGVAVSLTMSRGRCSRLGIVLGAVAPTPLRVPAAEALLLGEEPTRERVHAAAAAAAQACQPISDLRASAGYRRQMVEVLTRRALEQALEVLR
jgi:aerobic carbon-monoxide dehydrogenase medium subunit